MRSSFVVFGAVVLGLAACVAGGGGGGGAVVAGPEEITVTPLDAPAAGPETAAEAGKDAPKKVGTAETEKAGETVAPKADAKAPGDSQAEGVEPQAGDQSKPVAEEVPEVPKSPEQMLCEKAGGLWTIAGETGANICVSPTRDGGKQCRKKTDCEGQCLARSQTCAPFQPLFGCNDVLDKDGRAMTLCLD